MHEVAQAFRNIVRFTEYPWESFFEAVFEPLEPPAFRGEDEEPDTEEQESLEYRQEQPEHAEYDEHGAEYEAEQSFNRYWHRISVDSSGYGCIEFRFKPYTFERAFRAGEKWGALLNCQCPLFAPHFRFFSHSTHNPGQLDTAPLPVPSPNPWPPFS